MTMKLAVWTSLTLLSLFSLKENNTNKDINSDEQAAGFAVIELFTSEGCSSCPPADEALAQINAEFGTNVFALSFHVDYWDYLGWKDEFSNPMYSQRQQQYASVFKLESIYTPQVIVNGQKEFVGSDKTLLNKTITESLKATQNKEINIKASSDEHKNVIVNYETTADDKMVLNIAFVQLHAGSDVKRGENKGRKLKHVNVVREFKCISLSTSGNGSAQFAIPPGFSKNDYKVIAYLQDKNSLQITGAREVSLK